MECQARAVTKTKCLLIVAVLTLSTILSLCISEEKNTNSNKTDEESIINDLMLHPEKYDQKIVCVKGKIANKIEKNLSISGSPLPPHYPPYEVIEISDSGASIEILYFLQGPSIEYKEDIDSIEIGLLVEAKGIFFSRDFDGEKRIHVTNPEHYIIVRRDML